MLKRFARDIITAEGERASAVYDGETLPLSDALLRWAYDNRDPETFDARTLPRAGAGTARPGLDHKGNYPDAKSKAAYIREHGLEAFERLPLKGPTSAEITTVEQWRMLPLAE